MPAFQHLMTRCRDGFTHGSFARNVLVMFTGTAIGQFGAVLLAPLLTRIYTPDMFGLLGIFTAALSILSVISALRYEMALPLADSQEDIANVLALCVTILALMTALFCLAVFGTVQNHAQDAVLGALAPYAWLLPAGFFCIGAYQVMVYLATRQSAYGVIARTKVYQGGLGPLSQIGLGLAGAGPWGLMIGFIVGQSTGIALLFSRLKALGTLRLASWRGMLAMARRWKRFPLFSSWSGLIESAGSSYLLLVAIPLLYSHTIAGFVFLTDRVIGRPLLLVSTSILQVYVGDVSRSLSANPAAIRRRFLQLAGVQLVIVSTWLILVNALAFPLFPLVFGQEWQGAVPYLHVLSIAYLPQMVMHALVHTLQLMEKQGLSAVWETGRFFAVIAAFAVSYQLGFSALDALLAYSIVQAIAQIILFFLMYSSIQSLQKDSTHDPIP